jgi:zinc protease
MKKIGLLVLMLVGVAFSAEPQAVAPQASGGARELMESKAGKLGYGAENCRIVNERDEIMSVLKNGMVVICKRVPSPVLAVRGYIGTGGVYEGKWLGGGLSHLLEHLVAGGSSERRTEAQNRDLLQAIGNNSNAYTSEDHTAFFINTTPDHLNEAADLLTGWLLGAKITPDEYRREYQVVQRELEKGKGEPQRVFYYLGAANRYHVSPARVPVIGYQEVIQGLSRDDVYSYYKLAYVPENMVFSVAGDLDPEVMLKAIQLNVADAKPGREFTKEIPPEPPVLAPRTVVATFPKLGQAQLQLGFPSVKATNKDMFALDLLATILGGGESSVLVERLRDEKQLVSGVEAGDDTPAYADGTFEIQMQLDSKNIAAATEEALKAIEEIKTRGIDPDRIARAKTQMRVGRVKSLQTAESIAAELATQYMQTGDAHFGDRYVAAVDKVTVDELKDVAKRYLDKQRLLTTAMLPSEFVGAAGLPKAEEILRAAKAGVAGGATTKSTQAKASEIVRKELDNGTILLVKRIPTAPLVKIVMYSLGGVTEEDAKTNGLGKFAMDMAPRGTATRTAQQIAEFFDSIGGDLHTDSGNNSWTWQADCLKNDFARTMEVFGDVVANANFPESEITPMRQRLLAEIDSQDADWFAQANRFFKQKYFGPLNSPYQFMPSGAKEVIASADAEKLRDWYKSKILARRRVLAIFGDIDLSAAEQAAVRAVGSLPKAPLSGDLVERPVTAGPAAGKAFVDVKRVEVMKTEKPLAGVFIGYKDDAVLGDPQNYDLTVADTMTSGFTYPTGYIFEILRGRGLVYMADAQNWPGRTAKLPGAFIAFAGCDPAKVNEVIDVILENIARLQGTPEEMNVSWYDRSKKMIVTADALEHETPEAQANTAALDELYNLGFNFHDKFAAGINSVKLEDVQKVARERLNECVVTVCTPAPEVVTVKAGRREYASFPPVDLTPRGVQHDTGGK